MSGQAFRFRPSLGETRADADESVSRKDLRTLQRSVIDQFRAVQNDLDQVRGSVSSSTPFVGRQVTATIGGLLLLAPPSTGVLVGIPPATALNITKRLQIAVVGGFLSPGATVSIIGGKGTINGAATLSLASYRLVELVSCGPVGWFYST